MAAWLIWAFAAYTAATLVLSEYWHTKRVQRRDPQADRATLTAWLNTAPTRSTGGDPAWKTRTSFPPRHPNRTG